MTAIPRELNPCTALPPLRGRSVVWLVRLLLDRGRITPNGGVGGESGGSVIHSARGRGAQLRNLQPSHSP